MIERFIVVDRANYIIVYLRYFINKIKADLHFLSDHEVAYFCCSGLLSYRGTFWVYSLHLRNLTSHMTNNVEAYSVPCFLTH
jgi:hypothetical protein